MVVPLRDRQRTTCFVLHESIDCVISDTDHVTLAESAHSVERTEASQSIEASRLMSNALQRQPAMRHLHSQASRAASNLLQLKISIHKTRD